MPRLLKVLSLPKSNNTNLPPDTTLSNRQRLLNQTTYSLPRRLQPYLSTQDRRNLPLKSLKSRSNFNSSLPQPSNLALQPKVLITHPLKSVFCRFKQHANHRSEHHLTLSKVDTMHQRTALLCLRRATRKLGARGTLQRRCKKMTRTFRLCI